MFIKDTFLKNETTLSFEIFPPKNNEILFNIIGELNKFNPGFISVTYGAGGSSKDRTVEIASIIKNKYSIEALAHLTCITSTKEEIEEVVENLKENKIENILALRGDIPEDFTIGKEHLYRHAKDLIHKLKIDTNLCIGAAAYPEGHNECKDLDMNVKYLKEKVDAGADFLITQLFFDNNNFFQFKEKIYKYNIKTPIAVGIMPAVNKTLIEKIQKLSGVIIPDKVENFMNKYENKEDDLRKAGIEYASYQIEELIKNKVEGVHFYTMNKPDIIKSILDNISFK
ncbi:methylenetetrahydrofolate reductase [NAD(P)H] [Clostridium scatologenes]|uniref:Methylenetetrahydrofolate reductase n=1 Tax=Clostridium scatologenes TaxID=1548 RepID=A0A0E3K2Y2_CLOSL|nr:methylenetetrahydrofolate reductase [NAD(P)H] [Clostridium scatologenes]AKA70793.1 methylenetetrahydrofolate reductase (NAD(P)H) [Clostridium scatologenes]